MTDSVESSESYTKKCTNLRMTPRSPSFNHDGGLAGSGCCFDSEGGSTPAMPSFMIPQGRDVPGWKQQCSTRQFFLSSQRDVTASRLGLTSWTPSTGGSPSTGLLEYPSTATTGTSGLNFGEQAPAFLASSRMKYGVLVQTGFNTSSSNNNRLQVTCLKQFGWDGRGPENGSLGTHLRSCRNRQHLGSLRRTYHMANMTTAPSRSRLSDQGPNEMTQNWPV
ncbi:hypothetical protein B0T25DRAFT_355169 [Lasiosphaeria hispida]|uniref:Uncharacterized protein n=1 Tax=Lasiosphaeria hispida TaxID=260671 RepID=A0AAJ0M7I1_9PEZI|nr:hypothetical protein B0T25DRAFT_72041 [Lasiosphaeria hispida]KAK3341877.1 hypothetical protein B0T25DRAFT_355169 [Lasiosphaeria hispida]